MIAELTRQKSKPNGRLPSESAEPEPPPTGPPSSLPPRSEPEPRELTETRWSPPLAHHRACDRGRRRESLSESASCSASRRDRRPIRSATTRVVDRGRTAHVSRTGNARIAP